MKIKVNYISINIILINEMSFTMHRCWTIYLATVRYWSWRKRIMHQKKKQRGVRKWENSPHTLLNVPSTSAVTPRDPPFDRDHLRIELAMTGASNEITRVEDISYFLTLFLLCYFPTFLLLKLTSLPLSLWPHNISEYIRIVAGAV